MNVLNTHGFVKSFRTVQDASCREGNLRALALHAPGTTRVESPVFWGHVFLPKSGLAVVSLPEGVCAAGEKHDANPLEQWFELREQGLVGVEVRPQLRLFAAELHGLKHQWVHAIQDGLQRSKLFGAKFRLAFQRTAGKGREGSDFGAGGGDLRSWVTHGV